MIAGSYPIGARTTAREVRRLIRRVIGGEHRVRKEENRMGRLTGVLGIAVILGARLFVLHRSPVD